MFSKLYDGPNDYMTKAEFLSAHDKMFDKLDKNKNGFISQNEAQAMHSKCGEGKCGEGKCGKGKCGEKKCGKGKCGSGKCGSGKCGSGDSGSMKAAGSNTVDESDLKHSCSGKKAKSCCKKGGKSCSKAKKASCKHK